ncbi:hypothetical protein ACFQ0B_57820 [Nonomuraea thailandensis]
MLMCLRMRPYSSRSRSSSIGCVRRSMSSAERRVGGESRSAPTAKTLTSVRPLTHLRSALGSTNTTIVTGFDTMR